MSFFSQTSNESKKRKQAKKLVEKAKVIQQSKKTCVEQKSTLRRSTRNEASIQKSYCEDEVQTLQHRQFIHLYEMHLICGII